MGFLELFGFSSRLKSEKARLEAFLSAVPGEYCGWSSDGSVVYSPGFCLALGLKFIKKPHDLQAALAPEDAAALESLCERLMTDGIPFTMNAHTRNEQKTLRMSGTKGQDLENEDHFFILWLEDITSLKTASSVMEEEQIILRQDIDNLQNILDTLPDPVWLRDENQKIIWCNISYARAVDKAPSEVIEEQIEIIPPDRKKRPAEKDMVFGSALAKKAIESKKPEIIEVHEVLSGKRLLLKISETPLDEREMTVGMAQDVTEQENIQSQVKDNRSVTRALLEQLRTAVAIYNANQELDFYNSAFSQLWGLEDGWLNTKPSLNDIMEKLREQRRLPEQADFRSFKQSWLDMFTRLIEPHEDMLHLPDGSALRMSVVPHKLGGLVMTFEDVTSRLELESSYNTLVAVQKETLDNLAEGVAVYGGDGRLKLWNPAFGRLWKLDPEVLDGEPHVNKIVEKCAIFFEKQDQEKMIQKLVSLALDRDIHGGRIDLKDDTKLDFATMPLPDGGVMITFTDVTDTVRVEKALREKNAALETAEQLKVDFLANVSYQLRTPLSAIMGFNEMLDQELFGKLNEKQKEYTRHIDGASKQLLNLINDILDLSTIEAGQLDLDIQSAAVKEVIQSVGDLVEDWARKEHVEISVQCPANIGKADIDVTRVKQAIVNLVRNSLANIGDGDRIHIRAARAGDILRISVEDNGVGISEEDQKRILEPFQKIDSAQQETRGAGLGLSLVKSIAELHGGTFELESELSKGTTVTLCLPRSQSSDAQKNQAA
ncbi:MAG: PAS domain-containing protein [Alphaproteobacteria bacterium]|nr:PAS domain-containing protein [Alphaproteobacteria bacterium]